MPCCWSHAHIAVICVRSTRLLIHFKELKFQLFELQEPLFCTAALYDTATRTRISESFHFDYNGQLELGTPCATSLPTRVCISTF
jgi:hypothetical protein